MIIMIKKINSFQGKGGKIPENPQQKVTKATVIETTHGKIKPNMSTTHAPVTNAQQQVINNKYEVSPSLQFQKQDSSSDSEVGIVLKFLMTKFK